MAQVNTLIPFILYMECSVPRSYLTKSLDEIFERAKKSGYSNDKDDSGGATMCGVTIATYTAYRKTKGYKSTTIADLKAITFEEWRDIMKTGYWNKWQADKIQNQSLANILVDWIWMSGSVAITTPQRILGVKADGVVGPKTLAALNATNPEQLFNTIKQARINQAEEAIRAKPAKKKFRKGWYRRFNSITYEGLRYDIDN
jgi:lysozyme family protein